jgi:hypothetical protein
MHVRRDLSWDAPPRIGCGGSLLQHTGAARADIGRPDRQDEALGRQGPKD